MSLRQNLMHVKQCITQTEVSCKRKPGCVLLLAVSKQQQAEAIIEAYQLGIINFAENYVQEGLKKIERLKDLPLCWHFIGPIQSNKSKAIATSFSWVHSINRIQIAHKLNQHRSAYLSPLNVCLQINLVKEGTKSGIPPKQAMTLALAVSQLPHLKLRGLMTIPPPQIKEEEQYDLFLQLNKLMHSINNQLNLDMDTLSMGMSDDLVPAIKAGSTIVRIGRAIFGERQGAV